MSPLRLNGSTSGYSEVTAPATAANNTLTLPTSNGTSGQVLTTNGSGALSFSTVTSSQWTTTGSDVYYTTGKALVGVSSANASGGVLQLSSGITFPATQVTSSDANTLDDYEEGTWTPVLGTSSGGVATMTVQQGFYVKVGKTVQFSAQVVWSAKNTWSIDTRISGLPFTCISNSGNYGWANGVQIDSTLTTTPITYALEGNTTQGYVQKIIGHAQIAASDFPSSGRVLVNGIYQIA